MLGVGLSITAGLGHQASAWTPATLDPVFWAGGFAPSERLLQETAGNVTATAAGDPVGRVLPARGSVGPSQTTALARPTLAQHPKGGRRNLFVEGFAPTRAAGASTTYHAEEGFYSLGGLSAASGVRVTFVATGDHSSKTVSASAEVRQSGSATGNANLSLIRRAGTASSQSKTVTLSETWQKVDLTITLNPDNTTGFELRVNYATGCADALEIRHIQLEIAPAPGPYQKVISAHKVTENGVADIWHLSNDGGDSLPLVLPAGDYRIAWVDALGAMDCASITSNGSTGIDILRSDQLVDVLICNAGPSEAAHAALAQYWRDRYSP